MSLDFTKAFDNVDHKILMQKISGSLPRGFLAWISDYLSGRRFKVRVQGALSEVYWTQTGVPQGSVLGPPLFSMLVGDLSQGEIHNTFIQYADDVNIIIPIKNRDPQDIGKKVHDQLNAVENWCRMNKQKLNTEKSKLLLFLRKDLRIDDCYLQITRVKSLKVLGVVLNEKLKWEDHINATVKKLSQRLHILRVLKPYISVEELHQVYLAMSRSLADYCSPVFVKLPQNLIDKLQRAERRAHRIIYGDACNCDCDLDGFVKRRISLSKRLFSNIAHSPNHILTSLMPNILPHNKRYCHFPCRTNIRLNSFFPFVTLVTNDVE